MSTLTERPWIIFNWNATWNHRPEIQGRHRWHDDKYSTDNLPIDDESAHHGT